MSYQLMCNLIACHMVVIPRKLAKYFVSKSFSLSMSKNCTEGKSEVEIKNKHLHEARPQLILAVQCSPFHSKQCFDDNLLMRKL